MKKTTNPVFSTQSLVNIHSHSEESSFITVFQKTTTDLLLDRSCFSIGIHPQEAAILSPELLQNVEQQLQHPLCLAVGECGLDTLIDIPMATQETAFITQLQLAARYNKPVILHSVHTWDRCRFLHAKHAPHQPLIYHGFAKSSIVEAVLSYPPAMISLGERLLHSTPLQQCAANIPPERLFLETDNAAVDIAEVYAQLAKLKLISLHALTAQLFTNFKRVFEDVKLA